MKAGRDSERKWDSMIIKVMWITIAAAFIIEFAYYGLVKLNIRIDTVVDEDKWYIARVIFLPLIIRAVIAFFTTRSFKNDITEKKFDYRWWQIGFFTYFCIETVILHCNLKPLAVLLVIPVFISIIGRNRKITAGIGAIEILLLVGFNFTYLGKVCYVSDETSYDVIDLIIIIIAIACSAVLGRILTKIVYSREDRATENSNKYRDIFVNLPMGFAQAEIVESSVGRKEFCIVDSNEQFRRYFNLSKDDYEGRLLCDSHSEVLKDVNAWFSAYNTSENRDGEILNVEITMENLNKVFNTIMYTTESNCINMLINDITEQKETESKLSKAKDDANAAYKTQAEFLANMSHEIRTPINGILGMLQLTLAAEDLQADYRDNLMTAKNCADTLLRLINDILDISKLEAGKYNLRYTKFDIKEAIEETVAAQMPIAEHKGLTIDCNVNPGVPVRINSDSQRIKQVLNCLLSNAIKFTSSGGVRVKVLAIDGADKKVNIRIAVVDSGIGISDANMDKLFVRFSQIDGSDTRKYGGTGLGLVITKQIVELMGGTITVQSKEDVGSTFIVEIPVEVVETAPLLEEPKQEEAVITIKGHKQARVLVAEDEPVNQQVIGKLLGMAGYSYDIADNGEKAVDLYKKKHYDIALFDIQMPVMDGLAATKEIRNLERTRGGLRLPIIAVTARAMFGDKERILKANLDDYIAKPYNLTEVVEKLEKYIGPKEN